MQVENFLIFVEQKPRFLWNTSGFSTGDLIFVYREIDFFCEISKKVDFWRGCGKLGVLKKCHTVSECRSEHYKSLRQSHFFKVSFNTLSA